MVSATSSAKPRKVVHLPPTSETIGKGRSRVGLGDRGGVVAADQAGGRGVGGGQGADAAVGVDDLVAVEGEAGQQGAQAGEEVVDLGVVAAHGVGVGGRDVGRADQRAAEIVEDEADAAVVGLEVDHPAGRARATSSGWSSRMCEPLVPPIIRDGAPRAALTRSIQGPAALTTSFGRTVTAPPSGVAKVRAPSAAAVRRACS